MKKIVATEKAPKAIGPVLSGRCVQRHCVPERPDSAGPGNGAVSGRRYRLPDHARVRESESGPRSLRLGPGPGIEDDSLYTGYERVREDE